jgi:hypothetical protein
MPRFTILGLMALILGAAVGVAALRNADDNWAGGMMLATALLIGVATLGAVYQSGRRRAGRVGFAVFAGGYFALAFLGLSEPNLTRLPTTSLLRYVHEKVAPTPMYLTATVAGGPPTAATLTVSNSVPIQLALVAKPSTNRWQFLLPGAADYQAFSIVGHCLFALLAGLLGVFIARRYHARQDSVRSDQ